VSFTNRMKSSGRRKLPCGVPLSTSARLESVPFTDTRYFLPVRKSIIHAQSAPLIPYAFSLANTLVWSTESKAALLTFNCFSFSFVVSDVKTTYIRPSSYNLFGSVPGFDLVKTDENNSFNKSALLLVLDI